MDSLRNDIRYAFRTLARSPGFTVTVLATLALGIGANTAIFSFARSLVFEPLPYPDPDRVVMVWQDHSASGGPEQEWFTPADFADLQAASTLRASMLMNWAPNLTGLDEPQSLVGSSVSASYFDVVGVRPALGSGFAADADVLTGDRVVVLSDGLWRRLFGGDRGVIGRQIRLSDETYTVLGVMPAGFVPPFASNAELWRPVRLDPAGGCGRDCYVMRVLGRIGPDVPIERAAAEVASIGARIAGEYESKRGVEWAMVPLRDQLAQPVRPALFALLGAVGFVLLIACVNIANLLVARGASREREVAIRAALGAGRGGLVRQFMIESLVLAVVGGGLGVLAGVWGVELLRATNPPSARLVEVDVDGVVLAFAAGLSILTGLAFGLLPALQATRPALVRALKEGGPRSTPVRRRTRAALVVAEFAIALMLLVGAGLMMKSFLRLQRVDPGFEADNAIVANLLLPRARYPEPQAALRFYGELIDRLENRPDVIVAGASSVLPLSGGDQDASFLIEGRPAPRPGEAPVAWYREITPGYLDAMGMRVLRGRGIEETDREGTPGVILVNETLAARYWPNEDVIGKRMRPDPEAPWFTIVGVVADVRHVGLDQPARAEMFLAAAQFPVRAMAIVARTTGDPGALAPALRATVRELDPELPLANITTLEDMVSASMTLPRLYVVLFGVFAGVALLLAAMGIYSVTAFAVSRRTQEIGVRIALGARPDEVVGMVVARALLTAAIGVVIGLFAALALSRTLASLLFDLSPTDPVTYASIAALLAVVGLAGALVPALRAARVDPVVALRAE